MRIMYTGDKTVVSVRTGPLDNSAKYPRTSSPAPHPAATQHQHGPSIVGPCNTQDTFSQTVFGLFILRKYHNYNAWDKRVEMILKTYLTNPVLV